ncbi:ATP-dependent nuclease [Planctomyces sp. SH-PL14]|uniref:ATP-dependent nuclease n=1 Tax=Planctomyces sp. SH-PL14 TaxID=1632864 RepID=UPI00078D9E5C|nr:AAA family ATPase [Planctomyces sp. SH-PL14]AMV19195.1 glutamine ABC transporter ATP-binding protein [Planctomyces sp. SH-PL14]
MAKKAAAKAASEADGVIASDIGTKLRKLIIRNLGCIGSTPVEIDLDDVVVLVGRNNTGKSTILRAYEVLFDSSTPKLTIEDFPGNKVVEGSLPEIELHTRIIDNPPASKWIATLDGEQIVRERWTWSNPGVAKRQGFDTQTNEWSDQVPWGAANVANSRRPRPHRIDAFASPEAQTGAVIKLLIAALHAAVEKMPQSHMAEDGTETRTDYGKLIDSIAAVQKSVLEQAQEEIDHAQEHLTSLIQNVFRGYQIQFEAKTEEDLTDCLQFFKPGAVLRMGPQDGHLSSADKQGSGARRTLMWAALKYAAEKKATEDTRPNLLLMDEPELCLHPNAVREACNVLYNLPQAGKWQVMVTTHSPAFIDLSRDNTTVVRVERDSVAGVITGTTVFRPEKANLSVDEKEELKMLNLCDPHLCEFFFGGRTIVVEGDTEYTAFKYLIHTCIDDEKLRDVHIIRARGKATICLIAKILNQFNARYAVLHDSDSPTARRRKRKSQEYEDIANPAWTNNRNILASVQEAVEAVRVRLLALIPHFEGAFFGEEFSEEKPVSAWLRMKESQELCDRVKRLLYALLDHHDAAPEECCEWKTEEELKARYEQFANA